MPITLEPEKLSFYRNRLLEINRKKQFTHKRINLFSGLRLLSFGVMVAMVYLFSAGFGMLFLLASVAAFVALVVLIVYHQKYYRTSERLQAMFEINENEIKVLKHQASAFDDGSAFSSELPFADDLDLFGTHSLFHYLNRCQTKYGKKLLAGALLQSPPDERYIRLMQGAVSEMASQTKFNQDVMVRLRLALQEKQVKQSDLEDNKPIYLFEAKFYQVASWLMPVLVALGLLAGIITGNYVLFTFNSVFSLMLAFGQTKKMLLLGEEIGGRTQALKAYAAVFESFGKLKVEAELLNEMQQKTSYAARQFKQLSGLSERFDRRNNIVLYILANMFLLYDFHLARTYENWKRKYMQEISLWVDTLGRIELLISMGTYRFNQPQTTFPEITDETQLKAVSLGHPLIPEGQLVKNDIQLQLDPRIMLVTGSNMSGKSTFLRTLGVNIILAQAGAPVCASSFVWKPMHVLSSLRQSDSLQENTSLFLNELKQLKYILEHLQSGAFCLVLLDEVLRGTNSEDKYTGSYQLILKLLQMNSLVVMATHDLKLSKLEESHGDRVVNYCFESHIKDGKLLFDYTIKPGVAINRNATWLMRDMGIID
jgi:DNA mismatch repair ATPase MutS